MRSAAYHVRWTVSLCLMALVVASAQTPSPALLVSLRINNSKSGGVLAIVDPVARKVVGRIPIAEDPHGLTVSPDGRFAFIAHSNGNSVSMIDLAARKEVHRLQLGPASEPHDIQAVDGKVYFTVEGYKAIARYDPATKQVDWWQGAGQNGMHMMAVSRDASRIFTANNTSNSVTVFERGPATSPGWQVTTIPVGKLPEGIGMTPDGKEVWVVNKAAGGGISILDAATKKIVQTLDVQLNHANRIDFTPDGRRAIVLDEEGDLVVMDVPSRKEITRIQVMANSLLIGPDGKAYATVAPGFQKSPRIEGIGNHVAVIDLRTLELTHRIEVGNPNPDTIAWAQRRP